MVRINLHPHSAICRWRRFVYFIATGDLERVKIGLAVNPRARLYELQIGCPERLHLIASAEGDRSDERKLHEHFRESRLKGEWFSRTDELIVLMGLLNPWRIRIPLDAADVKPLRGWFRELIARANNTDARLAAIMRRL
ncbi:MAG TPA: GIY-YIG nuclease family protein [Gemmatimonadaceae bacterium]|jgi:hypothetical protein